GTAIAAAISENVRRGNFHSRVYINVFDEHNGSTSLSQAINNDHENVKHLPGIKLPKNLVAVDDLLEAAQNADVLIFCSPQSLVSSYCDILAGNIKESAFAVSMVKGLIDDQDGNMRLVSDIISEDLNIPCYSMMCAQSARELAEGKRCGITLGCTDPEHAELLTAAMQSPNCKVTAIEDIEGVELCGTLRDIVGLGVEIVDGLHLEENVRLSTILLGFNEMMRFIQTFCPSAKISTLNKALAVDYSISSNYADNNAAFAKSFVPKGQTNQEIESLGPMLISEVNKLLVNNNKQHEFPLFTAVHRICNNEAPPKAMLNALRNHPDWSLKAQEDLIKSIKDTIDVLDERDAPGKPKLDKSLLELGEEAQMELDDVAFLNPKSDSDKVDSQKDSIAEERANAFKLLEKEYQQQESAGWGAFKETKASHSPNAYGQSQNLTVCADKSNDFQHPDHFKLTEVVQENKFQDGDYNYSQLQVHADSSKNFNDSFRIPGFLQGQNKETFGQTKNVEPVMSMKKDDKSTDNTSTDNSQLERIKARRADDVKTIEIIDQTLKLMDTATSRAKDSDPASQEELIKSIKKTLALLDSKEMRNDHIADDKAASHTILAESDAIEMSKSRSDLMDIPDNDLEMLEKEVQENDRFLNKDQGVNKLPAMLQKDEHLVDDRLVDDGSRLRVCAEKAQPVEAHDEHYGIGDASKALSEISDDEEKLNPSTIMKFKISKVEDKLVKSDANESLENRKSQEEMKQMKDNRKADKPLHVGQVNVEAEVAEALQSNKFLDEVLEATHNLKTHRDLDLIEVGSDDTANKLGDNDRRFAKGERKPHVSLEEVNLRYYSEGNNEWGWLLNTSRPDSDQNPHQTLQKEETLSSADQEKLDMLDKKLSDALEKDLPPPRVQRKDEKVDHLSERPVLETENLRVTASKDTPNEGDAFKPEVSKRRHPPLEPEVPVPSATPVNTPLVKKHSGSEGTQNEPRSVPPPSPSTNPGTYSPGKDIRFDSEDSPYMEEPAGLEDNKVNVRPPGEYVHKDTFDDPPQVTGSWRKSVLRNPNSMRRRGPPTNLDIAEENMRNSYKRAQDYGKSPADQAKEGDMPRRRGAPTPTFNPPFNPRVRTPRPPFDGRDHEFHTLIPTPSNGAACISAMRWPLPVGNPSPASYHVQALPPPPQDIPRRMLMMTKSMPKTQAFSKILCALQIGLLASYLARFRKQ
ncbi:hypothetical protein KR018_001233, partial [Drosophila ironensis]